MRRSSLSNLIAVSARFASRAPTHDSQIQRRVDSRDHPMQAVPAQVHPEADAHQFGNCRASHGRRRLQI